jgi:hypothetical protein
MVDLKNRLLQVVIALALPILPAAAQDARIDIFIDNDSIGSDYRDASWGTASGGDFLHLVHGSKMPVETEHVLVGSTSGLIEYRHVGGSWDLFVAAEGWPEFDLSALDSLVLYLNAPQTIAAAELPRIGLEDGAKTKSGLVPLGSYSGALDGDPETWQRVSIPLSAFDASGGFLIERFQTVRFAHGGLNPETRRVFIDHIHAIGTIEGAVPPPAPTALETRDGDRSVILRWQPPDHDVHGYRIYRGEGESGALQELPLGIVTRSDFVDFSAENGQTYRYAVRAVDSQGIAGPHSEPVVARPASLSDEQFIELVQRTAFDYFWYEASPVSGQVRDRSRPGAACSIAATGMGLTALTIGIDRGWITREQGLERVLVTLRTLWTTPQGTATSGTIGHRGFFYHFLECDTALRAGTNELSSIDTALLIAGVLHTSTYFTEDDPLEAEVRSLADSIYERVEWTWLRTAPDGAISHGWYPDPEGRTNVTSQGFIIYHYRGYDEAMILYLLALGSPTHAVGLQSWRAYTSTYHWGSHYGFSFVTFPPLFGHQYSHLWTDFRGIADAYMRARGIDYFENSVRATLANRAYAVHNPNGYPNYGANEWGLTASDVPGGYLARGAPPAMNDDGTLAPTAPGGSFAFTPDESLAALRTMYDRYRAQLWGPYGFRDAYNIAQNWFATDHLGIDQGPFVIMIENHRTGAVWASFMQHGAIQRGLERADFQALDVSVELPETPTEAVVVYPNPMSGAAVLQVTLAQADVVSARIYDVTGREVMTLMDERPFSPGDHSTEIDASSLAAGVYFVRLRVGEKMFVRSFVKQ